MLHPLFSSTILSSSFFSSITSTGHSGQLCSQHTIRSHSDHSCPCNKKFLLWNSNSIHTSCNFPGSTSRNARAVEIFVRERRVIAPTQANSSSLLNERLACFVSIKTAERELRGCIGTVEPEKESLAEEIIANAINAATRDPRLPTLAP